MGCLLKLQLHLAKGVKIVSLVRKDRQHHLEWHHDFLLDSNLVTKIGRVIGGKGSDWKVHCIAAL